MINSLYRWNFAVLGLSPISVGFFCSGATNFYEAILGLLYGGGVCIGAMVLFSFWVKKIKREQTTVSIKPAVVSQRRSGPTVYFLAYILPVVLGDRVTDGVCVVVVIILALVCFYSECEENNPIAKIMGFRFYDVESEDGISVLVMSNSDIQSIRKSWQGQEAEIEVVEFDDGFYIHVGK